MVKGWEFLHFPGYKIESQHRKTRSVKDVTHYKNLFGKANDELLIRTKRVAMLLTTSAHNAIMCAFAGAYEE